MLAARLKNIFFTLLAIQIASVAVSFAFACRLVLAETADDSHAAAITMVFLVAAFFISSVSFLILFYKRMVRFSNVHRSVTYGGLFSAQCVLLIVGAAAVLLSLYCREPYAAKLLAGFTGVAMVLCAALHLISSHLLYRLYNHPRNKLKVLVLGMNRRTKEFCKIIKDTEHMGAEVYGYLDVRDVEGAPVRYLGTIDDLGVILRSEVIDMVSIFLPIRSFYDAIDLIIETCGFYGVTSYIVGNVFEADTIKRVPTSINDFGNMAYSSTTIDYVGLAFKRVFDFFAALAGLVVLSPVLLGVAAYIKMVSKGPVFFTQERIGFNKRSFKMVKFRTMIPGAEKQQEELAAMNEMDGPVFKITNDPRLIPGGSFLRRHSLDEVPQLWNVLRGDMSVVGPRPLSRRDYDLLKEDWQRKRFSMRPGLTCTWQVAGDRNAVSFMEWMQMDLDYIDQWRFGYDFWLILMTVKTVILGGGK
jgi:exopolysaccharide biosynthesis polyprenyl glycosylphosphotransferase